MQLFESKGLNDLFKQRKENIHREVYNKTSWQLSAHNLSNLEYALLDRNQIEPYVFDFDGITVDVQDEPMNDDAGSEIMQRVVRFYLPRTGPDLEGTKLYEYKPASSKSNSKLEAEAESSAHSQHLVFTYVASENDPAEVSRKFKADIETFKILWDLILEEVNTFNSELKSFIAKEIDDQQEIQQSKDAFAAMLGFPRK